MLGGRFGVTQTDYGIGAISSATQLRAKHGVLTKHLSYFNKWYIYSG